MGEKVQGRADHRAAQAEAAFDPTMASTYLWRSGPPLKFWPNNTAPMRRMVERALGKMPPTSVAQHIQ